jgi:RNA polymerase sigma-70 factor (ECF subfamily)
MQPPPENQPTEAFIRALTETQSALRGYCHASLGHGEEAKEAVQRTNITLWRKCGQWDPETDFQPWAISVAKFEVLGVIRDRQRLQSRFVFDPDVVEMMSTEASHHADESTGRGEALERCLGKLSETHRRTITGYYARGISIGDLAGESGKSHGAMKVILLRLRAKLRDCIEGQLNRGGAL